jgi:RNA recognition motif-containing protein
MSAIGLPVHILSVFQPNRPPLEYVSGNREKSKIHAKLTGIADFVEILDKEKRTSDREERKLIIQENPRNTLFLGKIPIDITERLVKREIEKIFGPGTVQNVQIVYDRKGKSRKYGFVQLQDDITAKNLYQRGLILEGHRVLVDMPESKNLRKSK